MNENLLLEICERYHLGIPTKELSRVSGGLIHKMWCLETDKGKYAIKQLDSAIMEKADMQARFELSESTGRKLLNKGIPVVIGLETNNGSVLKFSDTYVIVYDWVNGTTLSTAPASSEQAFLIGEIIAKIHKGNLNIPELKSAIFSFFSDDYWQSLVEEFLNKFPDASSWLLGDNIVSWNANAEDVIKSLMNNTVVSHGDIDQKNVIWKDTQHPYIIDWESVGKINPGLELMDAALNWGGLISGDVNEESLKALIDGYRSVGAPIVENPSIILRGCMIKWLSWLEFNMKRAITVENNSEEKNLGFVQTQNTVRNLKLISDNFDKWLSLYTNL